MPLGKVVLGCHSFLPAFIIISIHPNQKAIVASSFSETNSVKKTQQLGTGTYLRKPYTIEKIGMAVKSELEKEIKQPK